LGVQQSHLVLIDAINERINPQFYVLHSINFAVTEFLCDS